jgi:hypothetical protein
MLCKSLESSGRGKRAGVGNAHHGNQDHGVEDGGESLDTCQFDSNNEWGVTAGTTLASVKRAVGRDNETDEEEVDNVEDANTPDDLLGSLGDFLSWIGGLGSSKSSKFSSAKGKRGCNEDGTESVEAVEESTVWSVPRLNRFVSACLKNSAECSHIPVFSTDVTSVVSWDTTNINDYTQDHETDASSNFHDTENEFNLNVSATEMRTHGSSSLTSP